MKDVRPTLVIMAAGMGSRYGGLKQIDPVDEYGNKIIDFSIYDAVRAGFGKVVFVIKHAIEEDFKVGIGDRIARHVDVEYVFQETDVLPEGYSVPEGRVKPWGTGHAILCCKDAVSGPFAVINADDYYGSHAFRMIYDRLMKNVQDPTAQCMVGYLIGNTLTENGYVSRGVCDVDDDSMLRTVTERTHIEHRPDGIAYTEDNGESWHYLDEKTLVSMNLWGFNDVIFDSLEERFKRFLDTTAKSNPQKAEFYLPFFVQDLMDDQLVSVSVMQTEDKWFGVTYKEDKEKVVAAIRALKDSGIYPERLWE